MEFLMITGNNSTYAQAKIIKLLTLQHGVLFESCFSCFYCLRVELENKEYHHGGFQQQSPQRLEDR